MLLAVMLMSCFLLMLPVAAELTLRRWVRSQLFEIVAQKSTFAESADNGIAPPQRLAEKSEELGSSPSTSHLRETQTWLLTRGERWREEFSPPHDSSIILSRLTGTDVEGEEFTIRNRERTTSDQPTHFQNEILCFGGSTTFCLETADPYTWPSILQRLVNDSGQSPRFRVRNLGIGGTPGLERIMSYLTVYQPRAGDIAVFLFGVNDCGWKQYGSRTGMVHQHLPAFVRGLLKLSRSSELAGWIYGEIAPRYLRTLAREMANTTIKAAEQASSLAEASGARVLFVLQPNLFTLPKWSEVEQRVALGTARDLGVMISAAYESYRRWISSCEVAVSATHIFDQEPRMPYIGDWCHVNARGNHLISATVFGELKSRGWLQEEDEVVVK